MVQENFLLIQSRDEYLAYLDWFVRQDPIKRKEIVEQMGSFLDDVKRNDQEQTMRRQAGKPPITSRARRRRTRLAS